MPFDSLVETLAAGSPGHIMLLDTNRCIQFINKTAPGLTKEQVLGQHILEYLPDQQRAGMQECFDRIDRTREASQVETTIKAADGIARVWESRIGPVIKDDEITGYVLFSVDVSTSRKAQRERDTIFNLSSDMLCIIDFDGNFTRINPAFCKRLGYSEESILNNKYTDLLYPEDLEATVSAFEKLINEPGEPSPFENRLFTSEGKIRKIQWVGAVDPESHLAVIIGRDVTDRQALELQLLQSQKMDALGQLAGGVAHDFNNLLMAIVANAELGQMTEDIASIKDRMRDIEKAAARASELTRKLLTFSRHQPISRKNLDLNALISNFLKLLNRVIPENIEIDFQPDPDISSISGDGSQLEQVLMNLCVNARDAQPEGGRILIRTLKKTHDSLTSFSHDFDGEVVALSVEDQGTGVDQETLSRMFEPFFTTKDQGTGLGLSTAYGIVQKHGGHIETKSQAGSGTNITVYLPAADGEASETPTADVLVVAGGKETILIVEDEEMVADVATSILERAGYRVLKAKNGEEAIQVFGQNGDIDLIFMDVVMPVLSGPQAARQILEQKQDMPIIFASGYARGKSEANRVPQGYPLLNKPYKTEELLLEIRNQLDHR